VGRGGDGGFSEGRAVLAEISRAAQALPPSEGPPRPLDLLLNGLALLTTDGYAAAAATLQGTAKVLTSIPVEDVLRWGWMAPSAYTAVWDAEGMHAISARQAQLVRDAGALSRLPLYLSHLGIASLWMGDLAGAASLIAETGSVAAAAGSRIASYTLLRLRAMQGREAEATAAIATAVEQAAAGGQGMAAAWAYWAAAVLYNGLGRYHQAVPEARQAISAAVHPHPYMWTLPELVEAAARSSNSGLAREALAWLAETTQPAGTDAALGIEARCRRLLSSGMAAGELYREAIDRLSRTRLRPELARAHLLYGEWLRRDRRRADARAQLRTAHDMFDAMGMEAFASRARRELRATGETVHRRTLGAPTTLTAQDASVARLASDGRTNPEIGAQLFLSARTVEWHLRKIFTKLGVGSRRELRAALARLGPDRDPS
jgi:DNA-binding CsgD family transcriptional regulator